MEIIKQLIVELADILESKDNLDTSYLTSNGSNNGFEELVKYTIDNDLDLSQFEGHKIVPVFMFGHHFPDINITIDDKLYGLELKSRNNGSWTISGGSVLESISEETYEEIYVLFGSRKIKETHYHIKFKPYWQVADGIKVTHSPRYNLNMDADESDLFYRSQQEYRDAREMSQNDKIAYFKQKISQSVTKPTWYSSETVTIEPKNFRSLPNKVQNQFKVECLILFLPDILKFSKRGQINADYSKVAKYMLSSYFAFSSSTRDIFSAGGQFDYNDARFPKIVQNLRDYQENIKQVLINPKLDRDFVELISSNWATSYNVNVDLFDNYKQMLDLIGNQYLSDQLDKCRTPKLSDLIFN